MRLLPLVILVAGARSIAADAPHPTVVLIVADDMAYADLSSYGGTTPTPHIDSPARNGVRFTRFYANAPECTPTRTALLTGRYPQRVGGMECALGTGNVGRYDDALVIFMNDNGGTALADSGPYSGTKGTLYEGSLCVPCLVRWPGRLPTGSVTGQTALTMDFTRSILRIAGADLQAGEHLDGLDILAHVAARRADAARTLFWRYCRGESTWRSALDGDLKLIHRQEGTTLKRELFDLAVDLAERTDRLADRPRDAARLEAALQASQVDVKPAR